MKHRCIALILSWILLPVGIVAAYDLGGIDIHGFISQGCLISDHNQYLADTESGSFQFNELGINFSKDLNDSLRLGIQIFARDLGDIGNDEPVIDWAYADYRWRDWLGVRAGIIRVAHGLYNETRDLDMLRTGILLPQGIYNETYREAFSRIQGGGLYGDMDLGPAGNMTYQVMAGTANFDEEGGLAHQIESIGTYFGDASLIDIDDFDIGAIFNGSLQWNTPLEGLRLNATFLKTTGMTAKMKITKDYPIFNLSSGMLLENDYEDFRAFVLSVEYNWRNLLVVGEYMRMNTEFYIEKIYSVREQKFESYYLGASYRFTDWFELGVYGSVYYPDTDDRDGGFYEMIGQPDFRAWQIDGTVSARFDVNEFWSLKLECHMIDGAANLLPQDNPDGMEEDWRLFAAKVTYTF